MNKSDWFGVIPSHWQVKKIQNIFKNRNVKVSDIEYKPLSVTKNGIFPQLDNVAKSDDSENRKLVCKGDFVINSRSDRKQSCGVSSYDGSVSLINTVIYPFVKNVDMNYVGFLLDNYGFAEEFYRWGHGIVADLWTTRWQEMANIEIPIPPLSEQLEICRSIISISNKLNHLIKNQQQQIEKLKEYRQSLISEVVTKGLNPNVEYKDSGIEWIGQIPSHWKIMPLKYSHFITMGQSPKSESYNTDYIGKPFLGGNSDIKDGYSNPKYYTTEITKTCEKNDILMSVRAPVGTIALCLHDAVLGRGLCAIKSKISNEYSYFYMKFLENKWNECITGTTFESVNFDDIQNMPYIIPSIPEIESLLGYLTEITKKIDGLIKIKSDKIIKLNEYKKSLIYEYVTGKKKVK